MVTKGNHVLSALDIAVAIPVGLAVIVSCAVAGCQSRSVSGPAGSATTTHVARPIDACSMLSPQDISTLLETTVPGKSTGKQPDMGGCSWENPTTEESVSIEISNPGTAPNNTLRPSQAEFPAVTTPGPDGMRLMGGGMVEFAAGNRSNTVQVAVLRLSPEQANSAAIDLARKIAPQVPQ
ncbi:hypothetical protein [Mycobacterium scrofulaceum]|uniref:DUF3558 domain-containing protein n=1 Tax=Mycobacterium scrofulaceum TaxID=1783 RepID=A0A1A2VAI6_MYCSC|nr:hypothetical protein [Mycobacterium scrofulaceum]OBH97622.1 hypothetical protein A5679_20525 [Mycobacterium scrofulaceum]